MPTIDLEPLLAPLRHEGPRRFAGWTPALFEEAAHAAGATLARALARQPSAETVLAGYLRLVQEGIGVGLVRHASASPAGWATFLERCLLELVPRLLPAVPPAEQLPTLARIWNLGEGLRREPEWLDRYVNACAGRLRKLADLESFLVRTLEPVLTPARHAEWTGPFEVATLDLREAHEDMLPGGIVQMAPNVLWVQDRLSDVQIGVLLRHQKKSEVLGPLHGTGDYREQGSMPPVGFGDQQMHVAGKVVSLPTFRQRLAHVVVAAGFVVATTPDSQRLWIVETP